jgi:hypothetical protein
VSRRRRRNARAVPTRAEALVRITKTWKTTGKTPGKIPKQSFKGPLRPQPPNHHAWSPETRSHTEQTPGIPQKTQIHAPPHRPGDRLTPGVSDSGVVRGPSRSSHNAVLRLGARGCPCPGSRRLIPPRSQDGEAEESPSERSPGWAQRASGDGAWAAPSGAATRGPIAYAIGLPGGAARRTAVPIAYAIGLPGGVCSGPRPVQESRSRSTSARV